VRVFVPLVMCLVGGLSNMPGLYYCSHRS